jgi:ABC-type multidrug transport system fused ATPase/permease subunit
VWWQAYHLIGHFSDFRWTPPLLVSLGVAAALAETMGIGLAVMFLFAVLGQTEQIQEGGGLLGELYTSIDAVFAGNTVIIAVVFFVLIILNAALSYLYQLVTASAMNRVAERVRNLIHHQYVSVGYRYLQKKEHGELIHALGTESWRISEAFYSFARLGVSLSTVGVFGAGVFALSWEIGATTFVCGLAFFLVLRLLSRLVRQLGQETLQANQLLAERMLISLSGMRTLRVFAQEAYLLRVFGRASSSVRRLAIRMERIKAMIGPISEVASLGTLIIIAVVGSQANIGTPTIVACVLLLLRLQPHLREAESHRMELAGMTASLRNVGELLDAADKPWPSNGKREFDRFTDRIEFANTTFFHDHERGPTLDAVSFSLSKGQTTLLAGPSGSGKTTILNLLLRLYEPDAGRIMADGIDIQEFSRASWLARIAIAGQDVELIEGTLLQNIRLGDHDAPMEAVERVCAIVEFLDDIHALPHGFNTRIGAGGLSFSGGQRQRIGLARALLREPDILILDEAMSALEPSREQRIRERIAARMQDKTVLVVSHRADAAVGADAVIEIDGGRVTGVVSVSGG